MVRDDESWRVGTMALRAIEGYEFGPYRIDSSERLLWRGDELVPLPPKVADTLLALVQNAGRMVDKGDLMKAVWPDTFVEDGALTRNISLLRKTLGDPGDEAAYIETFPKRGYRFVAPVRSVGEPVGEPAVGLETVQPTERKGPDHDTPTARQLPASRSRAKWLILAGILLLGGIAALARYTVWNPRVHPVPPVTAAANVLAVMPFRNLGSDTSKDYVADGMTHALTTLLIKLPGLRVFPLEGGGKKGEAARGASWLLSGTILLDGGRIRVDATLQDGNGAYRWAETYERDVQNSVDLVSEVAEAIAGEIQVNITAEDRSRLRPQRPPNPKALDAYMRGRYIWNSRTEEGLRQAVQYFQQAIAADPTYALAYTGLADSYSLLGSLGTDGMPPKEAMPLAEAAALKAIHLDPDLADGHASLAYVKLCQWDLKSAEREFSSALELNPNSATARHWYSHYFMATGDLGKAAKLMRDALQLEPLSPSINIGVGWCLYYSRQYDQAIEQFRSVAESNPGIPLAHLTLGMAYQQNGQSDQAIEEYTRAAALSNNSPASVAALASAYAAAGKGDNAKSELARLEQMSHSRYVPAFYFATIHYAMGDLPRTFEWGWKSIGERCDYLMYLGVEPRVGKLAGNREFIRAMAALHR
jgi:DNA-binding winged helix-turn-helix (wHTH) protein/TolB-like protein/Tfp pilus assembly protein PilF